MLVDSRLREQVNNHPYPLLFATISGAHLYGFPSADSDYDLRGAHLLPAREVLGMSPARETVQSERVVDGMEVDLVTHDVAKFFRMLLKRNGYVLEQLYSPLVVHTTAEHEELKEVAKGCITRHHSYHYLGFAATQWALFNKESPRRVKPLLYVYRVLLAGIYLMRTGVVEANLPRLNEEFKLPYIEDLVARKVAGTEKGSMEEAGLGFHADEYRRLRGELEEAGKASKLPEAPTCASQLDDLLVRLRLVAAGV
jgi:predicted nucleotidyltransferase